MAIVYLIWVCLLCFSCLLLSRLLCMHPHFLCACLYCKISASCLYCEPVEKDTERASERGSERTQLHQKQKQQQQKQKQQNRNTTVWCEHQKQRKQKQQNRNNAHLHPLPFRSIAVCIGVRTLHLARHPASVFAPYRFASQLVALSLLCRVLLANGDVQCRGIQDPPFQGINRYERRCRSVRSVNCGRLFKS